MPRLKSPARVRELRERQLTLEYVPIDDLLEQPRIKILRALRWFDWVESGELLDAMNLPTYDGRFNEERGRFEVSLCRMARLGEIDRDVSVRPYLYRLPAARRVEARRYDNLATPAAGPRLGIIGVDIDPARVRVSWNWNQRKGPATTAAEVSTRRARAAR